MRAVGSSYMKNGPLGHDGLVRPSRPLGSAEKRADVSLGVANIPASNIPAYSSHGNCSVQHSTVVLPRDGLLAERVDQAKNKPRRHHTSDG